MAFPFLRRRGRSAAAQNAVSPVVIGTPHPRTAAEHLPLCPPPPPSPQEWQLYDALRFSVPVIDAAIRKIVRLTGGFRLKAESPEAQALLDHFAETVPVNACGTSLQLFVDQLLDSLLTYGNAVGEWLPDEDGAPAALLTANPAVLRIDAASPLEKRFYLNSPDASPVPLKHPERIFFAALDPPAGGLYGISILRGLPAVSSILMRIYNCIGQNYDRAGNIRYAVTYHPDPGAAAFAQSHAQEIADAWKDGIRAAQFGEVQDFVAVGDVDIKVIGADNQLFDTNVPVRQLLEQIISKLSIPPFLLGFSWATTERMSKQQADILTSELEAFRRTLSPILLRIGTAVLRSAGFNELPALEWSNINLQDETELAEARLKNAQAAEIEQSLAEHARSAAL